MNRKREVRTKVEVLLESGQAELVEGIVGLLYSQDSEVVDAKALSADDGGFEPFAP